MSKGHFTKYLTSILQNCQDHQKQGKSEKLLQTKGGEGDLAFKCNAVSFFWILQQEQGIQGKTGEMWIKSKVWSLVNGIIPMSMP